MTLDPLSALVAVVALFAARDAWACRPHVQPETPPERDYFVSDIECHVCGLRAELSWDAEIDPDTLECPRCGCKPIDLVAEAGDSTS